MKESAFQLVFGTGGLRAEMGPGPDRMNRETVAMATQGLANYILGHEKGDDLRVVISYDCRNNSALFARTAAEVLAANGIHVFLFESLRPTPEMSYAIRLKGAVAGIMITASHNPPAYNGYKVSWKDGGQITAPVDKDIVAEVKRMADPSEVRYAPALAPIELMGAEEDERYLHDILSLTLSPEAVKRHADLKIVYTPLHGCGVRLVPECLKRLGFKHVIHIPEQDINDGNFPTVSSPNPEEEPAWEMALAAAEREGADLVLATDPDADRMGAAVRDTEGRLVRLTGNQTAALLTWYLLTRRRELGTLNKGCYVVKTIVTTSLIDDICRDFGIPCHNVLTGWKYLAEQVKLHEGRGEFVCGGEESCGFNAGEFVRDKDAQLASALMAEMTAWLADQGLTPYEQLQALYRQFGYREETRFVLQGVIPDFRQNPPVSLTGLAVTKVIDYLKPEETSLPKSNVLQFVSSEGDVVTVRPSGTEPKLRIYFNTIGPEAHGKTQALRKQFGV